MTSKEILKRLKQLKNDLKLKFENVYVFGSTATYKRNEFSDIDLLIISKKGQNGDYKILLINEIKNWIKKNFNLNSDIIVGSSLKELKSICINQNIFKQLIKI